MNITVPTIQEIRDDLYCYISDAHKDAYGIRARFDASKLTLAELETEARELSDEVCRVVEREDIEHAECKAEFEAELSKLVTEHGAADRNTAFRWLVDAAGELGQHGLDYFFFTNGLNMRDSYEYQQEFKSIIN